MNWTVRKSQREVVDFYDPEYADMGNPSGAVTKIVWDIEAQTNYGEVFGYDLESPDGDDGKSARADTLVALFQKQIERGDLDPSYDSDWVYLRRAYGSQAYADNMAEEEYARMDDEERAHYFR